MKPTTLPIIDSFLWLNAFDRDDLSIKSFWAEIERGSKLKRAEYHLKLRENKAEEVKTISKAQFADNLLKLPTKFKTVAFEEEVKKLKHFIEPFLKDTTYEPYEW